MLRIVLVLIVGMLGLFIGSLIGSAFNLSYFQNSVVAASVAITFVAILLVWMPSRRRIG